MFCQVPRGLLETIKVPETSGVLLIEPNDWMLAAAHVIRLWSSSILQQWGSVRVVA
jgi:hypothetical protein